MKRALAISAIVAPALGKNIFISEQAQEDIDTFKKDFDKGFDQFVSEVGESKETLKHHSGHGFGHYLKGFFQKCPKTKVVQDFKMDSFLGTWYELYRAQSSPGEGECAKAIYTPESQGYIHVNNTAEKVDSDGKYLPRSGIQGQARKVDPHSTDGHLEVKFPVQPFWAPYEVLHTDYENIAVVHSCVDFLGLYAWNQQWVIHRKPLNSEDDVAELKTATEKAKSVLESNIPGFKFEDGMRATHQGKDCTY